MYLCIMYICTSKNVYVYVYFLPRAAQRIRRGELCPAFMLYIHIYIYTYSLIFKCLFKPAFSVFSALLGAGRGRYL